MAHFAFQLMPSAELFSLAWHHINCPSMTASRLVHFCLQQVVQGCLKRFDLEKLILSMDLALHLEITVFMIIHVVIHGSCLYSLTNQCACEISATACLLRRAPAKHSSDLCLISNPPHFLFHFHSMEFFFAYFTLEVDLWFV